jgi:hypothetical protein
VLDRRIALGVGAADGSGLGERPAGGQAGRKEVSPLPGTLPRLRFGWTYSTRLRLVDLAGNGIALDDAETSSYAGLPLGQYLRYDPVIAPVLLTQRAPGPGESLERVVIRCTDVTQPTPDIAERLMAPPKSTVQMAEWHGLSDTATGVDPAAYATIVGMDGVFDNIPYGAAPPALPYLPDPLARGASFTVLSPPGFGGNTPAPQLVLQPAYPGTWPQLTPLRLQLVEGAATAWSLSDNVVTLSLPKGETLTCDVSAAIKRQPTDPDDTDVDILALLRGSRATIQPVWRTQAIAGALPQVTPTRTMTFVHATQRPVLTPMIVDEYGQPSKLWCARQTTTPGNTPAHFAPYVTAHAGSTGKIEILAEWDEPVDDGMNPPSTHHVSMSAWSTVVQPNDPLFLETEDAYGNPVPTSYYDLGNATVQFADARYREVTFTFVSTSRYREYFPAEVGVDPANLTQISAPITVDVKTYATPPAPKVIAVVPLFGWQRSSSGVSSTSDRNTGVRIYLDRPWFVSGDNEVIGVLVPVAVTYPVPPAPPTPPSPPHPPHPPLPPGPGPHPNPMAVRPDEIIVHPPTSVSDVDAAVSTQWGSDPAFATATISTPFAPLQAQFLNAQYCIQNSNYVTFQEPHPQSLLLAFGVTFQPPDPENPTASANPNKDPNNGRWYCDILMDPGACATPFLRLAIVRFQPNTGDLNVDEPYDARGYGNVYLASRVVLTDFVQLGAGRSASLTSGEDPQVLYVNVGGQAYTENATGNSSARATPTIIATIQANAGTDAEPAWLTYEEQALSANTNLAPSAVIWTGTMSLPFTRGALPMRVLVQEFETLPTDSTPTNPSEASLIATRLVYADFIAVVG